MKSINSWARVAGFFYLLLGVLSYFGMPSYFIRPGEVVTTVNNIMASQLHFRLSILSALLAGLFNILVVLFLYKLLKPAGKVMASLMVIFILLGSSIQMLNEINRFAALQVSTSAGYFAAFSTDQLRSLAILFLDLHSYGIAIAGFLWGLWLFPMGYLVYKSGYIPRIFGILLMIGCFGYLVSSSAIVLFPNYNLSFAVFAAIGEILLPLWLLIKGVNIKKWEERNLESAA